MNVPWISNSTGTWMNVSIGASACCVERFTWTPDSVTLRLSVSKNAGSSASVGSAFSF